jgi:hypothetical protein
MGKDLIRKCYCTIFCSFFCSFFFRKLNYHPKILLMIKKVYNWHLKPCLGTAVYKADSYFDRFLLSCWNKVKPEPFYSTLFNKNRKPACVSQIKTNLIGNILHGVLPYTPIKAGFHVLEHIPLCIKLEYPCRI